MCLRLSKEKEEQRNITITYTVIFLPTQGKKYFSVGMKHLVFHNEKDDMEGQNLNGYKMF